MPNFSFVLLYVESPAASAAFYTDMLGRAPVEQSETFAMLPLAEGVMLGLWKRSTVEPAVDVPAGGSEVAFTVADAAAVDDTHANWSGRGVRIAQAPCAMDFGRTFVGLDPDGNRLRVLAPGGAG